VVVVVVGGMGGEYGEFTGIVEQVVSQSVTWSTKGTVTVTTTGTELTTVEPDAKSEKGNRRGI
jgi:hypothetical protein